MICGVASAPTTGLPITPAAASTTCFSIVLQCSSSPIEPADASRFVTPAAAATPAAATPAAANGAEPSSNVPTFSNEELDTQLFTQIYWCTDAVPRCRQEAPVFNLSTSTDIAILDVSKWTRTTDIARGSSTRPALATATANWLTFTGLSYVDETAELAGVTANVLAAQAEGEGQNEELVTTGVHMGILTLPSTWSSQQAKVIMGRATMAASAASAAAVATAAADAPHCFLSGSTKTPGSWILDPESCVTTLNVPPAASLSDVMSTMKSESMNMNSKSDTGSLYHSRICTFRSGAMVERSRVGGRLTAFGIRSERHGVSMPSLCGAGTGDPQSPTTSMAPSIPTHDDYVVRRRVSFTHQAVCVCVCSYYCYYPDDINTSDSTVWFDTFSSSLTCEVRSARLEFQLTIDYVWGRRYLTATTVMVRAKR